MKPAESTRRRRSLAAWLAVAAALGLAGVALADFAVYKNDFSSRNEVRELKESGGERCDVGWRKQSEVVRITLRRPPDACQLTPPVQGDSPLPDHVFEASGKVTRGTAKTVRDKAFVSISLRVGGGDHYELRVFPKPKTFQLRREPSAVGFPVEGTSTAIRGIDERNELLLRAEGSQIKAAINGQEVADLNDPDPGQVDGQKVEFAVGSTAGADRPTEGTFDKLKLSVPNP